MCIVFKHKLIDKHELHTFSCTLNQNMSNNRPFNEISYRPNFEVDPYSWPTLFSGVQNFSSIQRFCEIIYVINNTAIIIESGTHQIPCNGSRSQLLQEITSLLLIPFHPPSRVPSHHHPRITYHTYASLPAEVSTYLRRYMMMLTSSCRIIDDAPQVSTRYHSQC